MTGLGGSVGATSYFFNSQTGLALSNPALTNAGTYSIAMYFSVANPSFGRLIEFKNLTSDNGVYLTNGNLSFFNLVSGAVSPFGPVGPAQLARVVVTRDASTNTMIGYLWENEVFRFDDTGGAGVFSDNIMHFLQDDNLNCCQSSNGLVARIMIWDSALSASEVATIGLETEPGPGSAVPEPSTAALLASAAVLFAIRRRVR